ncbi:TIGR02678 family protein [Micromonospora sp. NBC_00898]|uniref:TIGR02678 family protein n=1 Tax=Micromonospora sp. NBC_00898 TaxID=2975981 RepID=UPI00386BFCBB|nr:TIGR02678 family protein [Micromonospora sp. NBC_00898]
MNTSTSAADKEAHQAFLSLLHQPLVTPATNRILHRHVLRHQSKITDHARRAGYRIHRVGRAVRLIRVPIGGQVTAPPRPASAPGRRLLSLACCVAACCEEVSATVTLQQLSDMLRDATAAAGVRVTAYDPEQKSQRRLLRDAAGLLADWGVLRRRINDERMLYDWTEEGSGPGAGYEVDRDALLLMTSPDVLAAALHPQDSDPEQRAATRTMRQLRALLEAPAVVYADLDEADAEALRKARGLRTTDLAHMTGGTVEARAEGLVLVLPDDPDRQPTVADWPRARAADWVALLMADLAGRHGARTPSGSVVLTSAQVDEVVDDLIHWRGDYMSKEQKTVPGTVRTDAETILTELGLLRLGADRDWTLSPLAARYRDPDITLIDPTEPTR